MDEEVYEVDCNPVTVEYFSRMVYALNDELKVLIKKFGEIHFDSLTVLLYDVITNFEQSIMTVKELTGTLDRLRNDFKTLEEQFSKEKSARKSVENELIKIQFISDEDSMDSEEKIKYLNDEIKRLKIKLETALNSIEIEKEISANFNELSDENEQLSSELIGAKKQIQNLKVLIETLTSNCIDQDFHDVNAASSLQSNYFNETLSHSDDSGKISCTSDDEYITIKCSKELFRRINLFNFMVIIPIYFCFVNNLYNFFLLVVNFIINNFH